MKKFLLYLVCAGLVAFFAVTLYLGKNPKVSDEYRAFYIDHTVKKWKNPGH